MAEVPGGLVRCVMQLRACTEKLRVSDAFLAAKLSQMTESLPFSSMPVLTSEIQICTDLKALQKLQNTMFSFPEALQLGMKRIDQMESEKVSLEGQISQRTVKFEDVLLRRNVEIQKEYKRSLRKLDLEMDVLNQAIEQKRRSSKRLRPCSSFDTDTIGQKKHKNLKEVLRRLTERVQLLQEEYTQLGLRDENMATAELDDAEQKVLLEEKLADLQKEAVLVEDDNEVSLHSVKDISEPENFAASVEEDIDQTRCLIRSVNTQIHSQRTRLLSLLRTLAPTASIGSLMVRLYQQLMKTPEEIDVTSDLKKVARQTVELRQFLQNCPDTSDGQRAIELMQKLRLVYAYESSGLMILAD